MDGIYIVLFSLINPSNRFTVQDTFTHSHTDSYITFISSALSIVHLVPSVDKT